MIHIILDTNFFTIIHKNKIDITQEIDRLVSREHQLETFTGVLEELEKMRDKSLGRDGTAARVALELIKKKNIKILEGSGYVDDVIIEHIERNKKENFIVCTADAEFKKKLREKKIGLICMRSQKKLELC